MAALLVSQVKRLSVLLVAFWLAACGRSSDDEAKIIPIGALLSLTGGWSDLGISSRAALEMAVADANAYFVAKGDNRQFALHIVDTELEPAIAEQQMEELAAAGVRVFVGPQSSSEVAQLKTYADANNLLLISQGSTAGSLAIAGDNVLRFCAADVAEAEGMAALMWEQGKRTVVSLWRDDVGNSGLNLALKTQFEDLGGTYIETAGSYPADASPEEIATAVQGLATVVDDLESTEDLAVYLASFDETVQVFSEVLDIESLHALPWYGGDGVAQSQVLLDDTIAAQVAQDVIFPTPLFGLAQSNAAVWQPLLEQIKSETGQSSVSAFALAAYDAVRVLALAYHAAGANPDMSQLKQAFIEQAKDYEGATGNTELDAAGDRAYGSFDFWAIQSNDGTTAWEKIGEYDRATHELQIDE